MSKYLKELSRKNWTTESIKPSIDEINLGANLRIADSLERIEKPYLKLISDNEYLQKRNRELRNDIEKRDNTIRSLRGWLTRLKRKEADRA